MRLPDFYILGAPKCGTTSVAEWLNEHPEAFVSTPKEPRYFNTDISFSFRIDSRAEYAALFANAGAALAVGEATTNYLASAVALDAILDATPQARFIICVREPVSLFFSLHRQRLKEGFEMLSDPRHAWDAQADRRRGKRVPVGCPDPQLLDYERFCQIGTQTRNVVERVGTDRVHVVFLEDLAASPVATLGSLCAFLGISANDVPTPVHANAASVPRSPRLAQALRVAGIVRRRLRLPAFGIAGWVNRYNLGAPRNIPDAGTGSFKAGLIRHFSNEVSVLSEVTGRDLSHWGPTGGGGT